MPKEATTVVFSCLLHQWRKSVSIYPLFSNRKTKEALLRGVVDVMLGVLVAAIDKASLVVLLEVQPPWPHF